MPPSNVCATALVDQRTGANLRQVLKQLLGGGNDIEPGAHEAKLATSIAAALSIATATGLVRSEIARERLSAAVSTDCANAP